MRVSHAGIARRYLTPVSHAGISRRYLAPISHAEARRLTPVHATPSTRPSPDILYGPLLRSEATRAARCDHVAAVQGAICPGKQARYRRSPESMQRQFEDVLLGSIELFCLAAELESFTVAANAAGVTPAAVSRSVARLEERLGVRLFVRTTRQIRLTDAGRRYFEQCRQALSLLTDAEREATGQQTAASGVLRISMPTPYGHYRVLPLLAEFRARYPGVTVEAHLSNRNIDFADEGFDLAIRGRAPSDSGLIARTIEDAELVVVASPAYLRRAGKLKTPDDLVESRLCSICVTEHRAQSSVAVQAERRSDRDDDARQLLGIGRRACRRDAGAPRCGDFSDLSLYRRQGHRSRNAQGIADSLWWLFAAVRVAVSARAASVVAGAEFCRLSDGKAWTVVRSRVA